MSSVLKDRATPKNPLGIIALFVFFIEAIATVSLGLISESPYVGHLVWFIILYPTFIAGAFFLLLWRKREALYSPADFRDDVTFKDILLRKVEVIEAKQAAAGIDPSTNLEDVHRTIDRLLALGDVYTGVNVGRAYFQEGQYEKSVQIFDYLLPRVPSSNGSHYKVLANRAYALIGVGRFRDAVSDLQQVRKLRNGEHFRAWHSVALAYAHLKLGETERYREWLEYSKNAEGFQGNEQFFARLYPEMRSDLRS